MELSKEAKRALVNAAPRRGARVYRASADVIVELLDRGLATRAGNLTDRGVMIRARVLDKMLDEM